MSIATTSIRSSYRIYDEGKRRAEESVAGSVGKQPHKLTTR